MSILTKNNITDIANTVHEGVVTALSPWDMSNTIREARSSLMCLMDEKLNHIFKTNSLYCENPFFEMNSVWFVLQNEEDRSTRYEITLLWSGDVNVNIVGNNFSSIINKHDLEKAFTFETILLLRWYGAIEHEVYRQIECWEYYKPKSNTILHMLKSPQWGMNETVLNLVLNGVEFTEETIKAAFA